MVFNYDVITFILKYRCFKNAWGSHFLQASSKLKQSLLKIFLKIQEKLKELEIMH